MQTRESRIGKAQYKVTTAIAVSFGMAISIFLQVSNAPLSIQIGTAIAIVGFYVLELVWVWASR